MEWEPCALHHGIQFSMEASLACHPARSTEWLDWVAKWCELWRIRTGPISKKSSLAMQLETRAVTWTTRRTEEQGHVITTLCCSTMSWHDHGVNAITTSALAAYRKVVYKSRGFCAFFQLFGAASIQVRLPIELRLLFAGSLYAMISVCKTRGSSLAWFDKYSESENWLCFCQKSVSKRKQTLKNTKRGKT